ncbi:MAG TPA: DUF4087 domain-containing protein [Allosphingosinicella sp.]|nr:DUF4087 domain-containing protein [Allosphingosinicella sp.]
MRLPIGGALLLSLMAAGCSPDAAPEHDSEWDLVEADLNLAPAATAAAVVPAPAATAAVGSAGPAPAKGVRRCGWLSNPTPANWWLTDSKGQWILATQGADQAPGMDEMPDMSIAGWVETNGHYGYGCACLTIVADAEGKVARIADASPRPLKQCRADRKLPKPE